jgi:hypothetical protein
MAEHVACMGEESNGYRILVGKSEGKRHFRDLIVNLRIMLKGILEK